MAGFLLRMYTRRKGFWITTTNKNIFIKSKIMKRLLGIILLLPAMVLAQTFSYPAYTGTFGGAVYNTDTKAMIFPSDADAWGGFVNENQDIYPLSFPHGGTITFKASATANATLKFRFEANAHPDVDPAYNVAPKAITAAEATYSITLASQGTNTFNSAVLYLVERNVEVFISDIVITEAPTPPAIYATLSDLQVDGVGINRFDGAINNYTYNLPIGTTVVPQISEVTTTISGATTAITQATAIPGSAKVEVTATDGSTKNTYEVSFIADLPITAAPTPPARNAADVISFYSDAYTAIASNFDAAWCGANSVKEVSVAGNAFQAYLDKSCQGIVLDTSVDASAFTNYHVDVYIDSGRDLDNAVFHLKFLNTGDKNPLEVNHFFKTGYSSGEWISLDGTVDLSPHTSFQEIAITSNLQNKVWYDNFYIYKGTPLSVGEIDGFNFVAYPNPIENTLNVRAGDVVDSVTIFDLTGREVLRATPNAAAFSLDVSSLNKGLYLVTVKAGEQELNTKLVK